MNQLVEQQICEPVTIVIFGASGDLTHRKFNTCAVCGISAKLIAGSVFDCWICPPRV